MKVMVFVPQSRQIGRSLASIHALDCEGHDVTTVFRRAGNAAGDRYDDITQNYWLAQQMFLRGDYHAMLTVEDDIIIPPDALQKLAEAGRDVTYGLATWRYPPYRWSAVLELEGDNHHMSLDERPNLASGSWGAVVDVVGCGLFCTLIRRNVLEAVEFQRRGKHCCDWYFSQDCNALGFSQAVDTNVLCGHVLEDSRGIVWPTVANGEFYRIDYGA